MGVDSLMAPLTSGRIIRSYTPMRKIHNLFHNGRHFQICTTGWLWFGLFCLTPLNRNKAVTWSSDVCPTSQFTQWAPLPLGPALYPELSSTGQSRSVSTPSAKLVEQKSHPASFTESSFPGAGMTSVPRGLRPFVQQGRPLFGRARRHQESK